MGNNLSAGSTGERNAFPNNNSSNETKTMNEVNESGDSLNESEIVEEQFHDTISEDEDQVRSKTKEDEMIEFRKQLSLKREQRKEILARHRSEKKNLEKALQEERNSKLELIERNRFLQDLLVKNRIEIPQYIRSTESYDLFEVVNQMKEEFEILKSSNNRLRCDLAESNNALQIAYSDIADLSAQNTESIKQINALKEVIAVSKTMINLREQQLGQLKDKLNEIEQSLADRETNILSVDLRHEYERQLQNIRTLRGLYEERARLAESTRQALLRELEEQKLLKQAEIKKCKNLTETVEQLETKVSSLENTIEDKNNQIAACQDETRGLQAEMAVVNKLFSQVLLGYKTKKDLDQLIHRLEENHDLLTHMAEKENGSESSSALPKLLLELVNQIDENENCNAELKQDTETSHTPKDILIAEKGEQGTFNTKKAEEIVQNLPKVWRVLMELLSQQSEADTNIADKVTTCYKSVETKSGPVLVPSVSQTYIRLKDLIIEKLSLIKEVNRMKQLNTHLESRLGEQERRLCLVTTELSKTWHVVGRLRRHHHQLHTHEKILKYELQQKRKLLNELKEELEYCREKWEQAREKNSQSERDWKKLRTEFSNRKIKPGSGSLNNSAESGYSDERASDESSESIDDSEYITEPKIKCKKKVKKSFETVLDSSTDFNLAAEREDPASDMLDVADLPLDTQDDVPESYEIRDCSNENVLKNDGMHKGTENESGTIANDSYVEESIISDPSHKVDDKTENLSSESSGGTTSTSNIPVIIDAAAILKSIKEQNERLANKDKRLEYLEKGGVTLLKKTETLVKYSNEINSALDHVLNRPTTSQQNSVSSSQVETKSQNDSQINTNNLTSSKIISEPELNLDQDKIDSVNDSNSNFTKMSDVETRPSCSFQVSTIPKVDSKVILERVGNQNESLEKNDPRLQSSDNDSSKDLSQTITDDKIPNNVELFPAKPGINYSEENSEKQEESKDLSGIENSVGETSTISETNHAARFAARDLRLKRLEEQTKSLVNKVNKTATKGVKINYKLEELHNIYGSDQSRSGTPSEESEDISQGRDEDNNENEEPNEFDSKQ